MDKDRDKEDQTTGRPKEQGSGEGGVPVRIERASGEGRVPVRVERAGGEGSVPVRIERATGERPDQPEQPAADAGGGSEIRTDAPTPTDMSMPASPSSHMRRLTGDMDRLFADFGWSGQPSRPLSRDWSPRVEVVERGGRLKVRADLPGVGKDDVHVTVAGGVLTLEGQRKQEHQEERDGSDQSERSYGSFCHQIQLPVGVGADQVQAEFTDGVLEIEIPVPEREARGRKVMVRDLSEEPPAAAATAGDPGAPRGSSTS